MVAPLRADVKPEEKIEIFPLTNSRGMRVGITNFGAAITEIDVIDKKGEFGDVALGFKNPEDYKTKNPTYQGVVAGRVANRIKGGKFNLGGKEYQLATNDGKNHLHGGKAGFDKVMWHVDEHTTNSITLSHLSRDGDQGYPGKMEVRVTYTLKDDNDIHVKYWAQSNKDTPVNLTNHTYFNLKGEGNGTIVDHKIQIDASRYTPTDEGAIPTGIKPVKNTPFDLRKLTTIADGLKSKAKQILFGKGYDHNFVLDAYDGSQNLHKAAHVEEVGTGRVLDVSTTEPGVQLYTGNYLDGTIASKHDPEKKYVKRGGFCLETQHFPDAINHQGDPQWPSVVLHPGQTYESETVFKFSVKGRGR